MSGTKICKVQSKDFQRHVRYRAKISETCKDLTRDKCQREYLKCKDPARDK